MKPLGISDTKRFVIVLSATKDAVVKIDVKLPQDAQTVTGVFFSFSITSAMKGIISLRFSEGSSNPLLHQTLIADWKGLVKKIKYTPLNEPVMEGTTLTGYYRDTSTLIKDYTLKIYIEYVPRKTSKP